MTASIPTIDVAYAVLNVILAGMVAAVALRFATPAALHASCRNLRREHARFARGFHYIMGGFLVLALTTALAGLAPTWFLHALTLGTYPVFFQGLIHVVRATWDLPRPVAGGLACQA